MTDVYEYVWKNFDKLDSSVSLRPFLYTLVRSRSLDFLRKEKTKEKFLLEKMVNDGLKKRGLQTETAEYMDLDYIDDATMRPVRLPKEAPPESLKDTQDGSVK